jgi:uncharacterized protein
VTGVSRTPKGHGSNVVYQRLRDRGYAVFAINPNAERVEGDPCYPDLKSAPGGVEAVVIATSPANAEDTMRECVDLGIQQVWMHRGPGAGSVSAAAATYGREHGITVIDGGCPRLVKSRRGLRAQGDPRHVSPDRPDPQAGVTGAGVVEPVLPGHPAGRSPAL